MPEFKDSEIIYQEKTFCLHKWGNSNYDSILVVPPHAGRHGNIVQKLVNVIADNKKCVYAFELYSATYETRDVSISDLVSYLEKCIEIINKDKIDIVGVCQGGWLSVILTALNPNKISKLALMAAPIDIKADPDNRITKYCEIVPYEWFELIVNLHSGIQCGLFQWLSFAAVSPVEVFLGRHMRRFFAIINNDQKLLNKFDMVDDWYDSPQDLSGTWFLEAIYNLFIHNKLVQNQMIINDEIVDLTNIKHPLYLYAGKDDEITSSQQLFDISKYVSSTIINKYLLPNCGHTRVFTGNLELELFKNTFL